MERRRLVAFASLLIACFVLALTTGNRSSLSQPEEALPPQLIDIWPAPGAELLLDEPLVITFDQPMGRASVEAALAFTPALQPQYVWTDPQTLTAKPTGGWSRDQKYTLTLRAGAAAMNGLKIQAPYSFRIQTLSPLLVAQMTPAAEASEVALDGKIIISFNRPVIALGERGNTDLVSLDPVVAGRGEWINTSIYAFVPAVPLQRNTKYTVRVKGNLRAVDGALMERDFTWTFHTIPPKVSKIELVKPEPNRNDPDYTKKVVLDQPITITFDQSMDTASTEAVISLSDGKEKISGKFTWNFNGDEVNFKPDRLLKIDTDYVITVAPTAKDAKGAPLAMGAQLRFHTQPYPAVENVYPENGAKDVHPGNRISISFNVPLRTDREDVLQHIHFLPAVQFKDIDIYSNWISFYDYNASLEPNTTYTVTVKAGLKDHYGNPTRKDYTFSFTTGSKPEPAASVAPQINGDLMITSAERENTSVDVLFTNTEAVKVNLYRLPPDELGDQALTNHQTWGLAGYVNNSPRYSGGGQQPHCAPPPAVKPTNLLRSWSATSSGNGKQTILLASDRGGKLPPGLYWITMGNTIECTVNYDPPFVYQKGPQFQFGLAVVTANLTIKRGTEDVFVWVTSLTDTKPIAGAKVSVYSGAKLLSGGITDANGAAKLPVRVLENAQILVTAQGQDSFAAWYNYYGSLGRRFDGDGNETFGETYYRIPPDFQGYAYTDRPIYRPGDTVYVRGVLRNKRDMAFPVTEQRTAYVKIGMGTVYYGYLYRDLETPLLADKTLTLSDFGTFDGVFQLPAAAKPGTYYIRVSMVNRPNPTSQDDSYYIGGQIEEDAVVTFTVASYRASDFEVKVKPDKPVIFQGEPLQATVQGLYYSGGAVRNAQVMWKTVSQPATFRYTGVGGYAFGASYWGYGNDYYEDYADYYYYGEGGFLERGTSYTDLNGQTIVTTKDTNPYTSCENCTRYPAKITLEATLNDETGQTVSGRTSFIAYPTNLYIGMAASKRIARIGEKLTIDLLTVNADSSVRPKQTLTIEIDKYVWTSTTSGTTNTEKVEVTTGVDGKAQFTYTPTDSGSFFFTFKGQDEKGRASSSTFWVWVTDSKNAWAFSDTRNTIIPITDKRSYRPGETADILIPVPFAEPAYALITAERAGVITYAMVPTDGPTLRYQMPITDDFAPTAYFKVTFITKADKDHPYPRYRITLTKRIDVEPIQARLNVSIKPSASEFKPGDTVTFDLKVTDSEGKPVKAEVGLALVDKAVLALLPPNSESLGATFYRRQAYRVYTDLSLDGLLEAFNAETTGPDGHGGGGCCGGTTFDLREKFETTPLWLPHVVTDENGNASVSVKLPDNLTTWQLDARALTMDLKVGQATTEIVSSLPLIVRPVTPRFFVAGDEVELAAVINNNTDRVQTVTASLLAKGVQMSGKQEQVVAIPAYGRSRVVWPVTVLDVEGVDLAFRAASTEGLSDASKPTLTTGPNGTIPVYRYLARDQRMSTSGVLRTNGSRTEGITLPPRFSRAEGDLILRIDPSLGSAVSDSFTFLRQYPYFCIEQTVSRFLPNVHTYKALRALNLSDPTLEANLKPQLAAALDKLTKEQKSDGSWSWYPGNRTDPLTTAYAALGLLEAKSAGFVVDSGMTEKAVAYVRTQIGQPLGAENWQLNRQAFYLYVLARGGRGDKVAYDALFAVRERLSIAARAYLLLAYAERFPGASAVKSLTNDLLSAASLSATGVSWTEKETDWWNWGTDVRTTALALDALIRVAPDSDLLPNAVRWLMAARQADHWPTTQETVWSIAALTDWMLKTGELRGNYTYSISFNRKPLANSTITPESVRDVQTLRISVKELLDQRVNRLTLARSGGVGALYYQAQLNLQIPASQAHAASQGISIRRQYFVADDKRKSISLAKVGDLVTVRLTITVPHDVHYFALEDTFPAGTEAVDTSLLTTSQTAEGDSFTGYSSSDTYWYWGWRQFQNVELRDAQLHLYADLLPAGTYVYTYQLRATVAGQYQTIPTFAYSFYFPEIFGRSEGDMFIVEASSMVF